MRVFLSLLFASVVLLGAPGQAQSGSSTTPATATGVFEVKFAADPAAVGSVVWVIEANRGDTWREIATTDKIAPVQFQDVVAIGQTYRIRMRTRSIEAPSFISEPSAESAVQIPAALAPPNAVQLRIVVTVTVAP